MSKNITVVFTKTNARILVNNNNTIAKGLTVLKNPKIEVEGTPPQYWKPDEKNNKVVRMTHAECMARDYLIKSSGIENQIFKSPQLLDIKKTTPGHYWGMPVWIYMSMKRDQKALYLLTIFTLILLLKFLR